MTCKTTILYQDGRVEITEGDFNECWAIIDVAQIFPEQYSDASIIQMTDHDGRLIDRIVIDIAN